MYSEEHAFQRIKEVFEESSLSQAEFSRKIGVTQASVSLCLKKGIVPSTYVIAAICEVFDISADWLLLGRGPKRFSVS